MRLHLKFKSIHRTVLRATSELFDSRPWSGTDEEKATKFERWLRRAADAYGIPAPTLEVREAVRRSAYDLGQITLPGYSVIELFHCFRHHMQAMAVANLSNTAVGMHPQQAAELDAVGWACSLFYKVRPIAFRKAVRAGKIRYVSPRDLLTGESQVAYDAQQATERQERMARAMGTALDGDGEDLHDLFGDEPDDSYDDPDEHDDILTDPTVTVTGSAFGIPAEELSATVANDQVTTQEAAAILGVSTSRVLQITDRLGGVREGRRWSFSRAACQEYLASR